MESKEYFWFEDVMRPAVVEYQKTAAEDVYANVLHKPFCALCSKLFKGTDFDREDATQEAVEYLLSKLGYFDASRPIKTLSWATTVVRRFYASRYKQGMRKLKKQILAPDFEDVIWPNFAPNRFDEFCQFFKDPANVVKVCGHGTTRREVVERILKVLETDCCDCRSIPELARRVRYSPQGLYPIAAKLVQVFNARRQ